MIQTKSTESTDTSETAIGDNGGTAIGVEQLSKTYRDGFLWQRKFAALSNVSFDVRRGEVFGLLGPNGAGKTTFLKILLGIIRKSGGRANMLSLPAGSRPVRRKVGYLPEQLRIPRHLSGNAALEFYGNLNNLSRGEVRSRREELLKMVGLDGRGNDSVHKYSKGMLQRLGLAQALLHQPELLVLDEPTDGLDPRARAEMRTLLRDLCGQGVTVFLNSHILQEVELVCDRVAILDRGYLRYCGSVSEIGEFVNERFGQNRIRVNLQLDGSLEDVEQALSGLSADGAQVIERSGTDSKVSLVAEFASLDIIDQAVDLLRKRSIGIRGLARQSKSLEDAFLQILDDPMQQSGITHE